MANTPQTIESESDFKELKGQMVQFAFGVGNDALGQAVSFSRDRADLRSCVRQAHAVGSEHFKKAFGFLLND